MQEIVLMKKVDGTPKNVHVPNGCLGGYLTEKDGKVTLNVVAPSGEELPMDMGIQDDLLANGLVYAYDAADNVTGVLVVPATGTNRVWEFSDGALVDLTILHDGEGWYVRDNMSGMMTENSNPDPIGVYQYDSGASLTISIK